MELLRTLHFWRSCYSLCLYFFNSGTYYYMHKTREPNHPIMFSSKITEEFKVKNPNFVKEWSRSDMGYCAASGTLSASLKRCPRCRSIPITATLNVRRRIGTNTNMNDANSKTHSRFS